MMVADKVLQASGLCFSYGEQPVLSDVSVALAEREIVALVGPSGCGKSTLLRLLAGLEENQTGTIERDSGASFSFVFQEPSLMPWATVEANITLPLRLGGEAWKGRAAEPLHSVGLKGLEGRFPNSLSGGQKMRVSIARALAANPKLLFLDEPFAALDEIRRFQMNELVLELREKRDLACLFVTHSIYEAAYLADRVLVMAGGTIQSEIVPGLDRHLPASEQRASDQFMHASRVISASLAGEGTP